jgi:hypothetical protein
LPSPPEYEGPYWRPHASDIGRYALLAPDILPRRVLAPHLGAVFGSPGGFPFFSHPFRAGDVSSFNFVCGIFRGSLSTTVMAHGSNDRLTALIDIYVPHDHLLAALSAVAVQSLHLRRESSRQFRGAIDVGIHPVCRLAFG